VLLLLLLAATVATAVYPAVLVGAVVQQERNAQPFQPVAVLVKAETVGAVKLSWLPGSKEVA